MVMAACRKRREAAESRGAGKAYIIMPVCPEAAAGGPFRHDPGADVRRPRRSFNP
jgi:hypothetical protein